MRLLDSFSHQPLSEVLFPLEEEASKIPYFCVALQISSHDQSYTYRSGTGLESCFHHNLIHTANVFVDSKGLSPYILRNVLNIVCLLQKTIGTVHVIC